MGGVGRSRMVALLALAGVFSACASASTMTTASTVKPGTVRWSPAFTIGGAVTDQKGVDVTPIQPQVELGLSVGVIEDFELGLRGWTLPSRAVWTWGLELRGKVRVFEPKDPNKGVHVSLAPRVQFHRMGSGATSAEMAAVALPVLVGVRFGDQTELVIGPQVGGQFWFSEGAAQVELLTVGASLGAAFWISDCFALMPEASIQWSTLDTANDDDRIWFFQLGLGVLWDT